MHVIKLAKSLAAWRTPKFEETFKIEMSELRKDDLPLQRALKQSSHVADRKIEVVILQTDESDTAVRVKAGIFFYGIVAGSCCADDPSSNCEQAEFCEAQFHIDKITADTRVELLDE